MPVGKQHRGLLGWLLLWGLTGHLGCLGTIILLVVVGLALYLAAYVLLRGLALVVLGGALFGAVITLRNYALALYHNVRPQRAP